MKKKLVSFMNHHAHGSGMGASAQNEASASKMIDRLATGLSEAKNDGAELDRLISFGGAHASSLFVATDQAIGAQKAQTTKHINGLPSMNHTLFKRVQSTQALGLADEMDDHVLNIRTGSVGEHEGSLGERQNSTEYGGATRGLGLEQASALGAWKEHAASHIHSTTELKPGFASTMAKTATTASSGSIRPITLYGVRSSAYEIAKYPAVSSHN
jgi:hypothetical protein